MKQELGLFFPLSRLIGTNLTENARPDCFTTHYRNEIVRGGGNHEGEKNTIETAIMNGA